MYKKRSEMTPDQREQRRAYARRYYRENRLSFLEYGAYYRATQRALKRQQREERAERTNNEQI